MDTARRAALTPHRILTAHFLRQLLDNDLISPEADRSQLLAVVTATLLSITLFVSAVMSFAYVGPLMTPGLAAVMSLDDKFFYLALAMIATALLAASQWDALSIDARDAAILEPLPIPARVIRRAKLSAVAMFGAGAAIAVNACATIVFPALLVYNLRSMTVIALLTLMAAHALFTIAASGFGYLTVIALREALLAILGVRWFTRVTPWVQSALIVVLGGSLLILPPAANRIAQHGFDGWRVMTPPMWFLGAYETAVGGVIADLPRTSFTPRQANNDRRASAIYDERRDEFPALARRVPSAVGITLLVAVVAYLWNARRLPSLAPAPPPTFRRQWGMVRWLVNALLVRRDAARAGFYFAMAAMWRSNAHRLTLACAAAVGFAMAVVAIANLEVGGAVTPRALATQPLLFGALLVGFRHVIRVPAELRANWGFQLAWRGSERAFVAGVKSAAIVALAIPAIATLLPLFVLLVGPRVALLHAGLGLAGAVVLLEALMVSYEKVPFTCSYLPSESMKALAPIYVIAFVIGASIYARMQYHALLGASMVTAVVTLGVIYVILRVMSARRPRLTLIDFDEVPATFQRLGLDS
jgi:hypothetical protein